MRQTFIPLFIFTAICSVGAQTTWHKSVSGGGYINSFCQLLYQDGQYLMKSSDHLYRVDESGSVTGNIEYGNSTNYISAVLEQHSAGTGHPYFILAQRSFNANQGFYLQEFRPGKGLFHQQNFQDSLGPAAVSRPKLVSLSDSVFVVFGGKFYRKIQFSQDAGFSEIWAKPLQSPVADALLYNNQLIVSDDAGSVYALDFDGNTLWTKNTGHVFRTLRITSDGMIGCVRSTTDAMIVKLDFNGNELWSQTSSDIEYFEAAGTPDGGLVATGISGASRIALVKFSGAGGQIWRQEYAAGAGTGVQLASDGGFVVLGRKNTTLYFIKTDANGDAPPVEEAFIQNRRIKTPGIQATFLPSPSLFFDGNGATLISPPDSAATILSFAPWIAGLDNDNALHIAAADYATYIASDYRPGLFNSPYNDFNRVWLAKRDDIDRLRLDFGTDQTLDQPVPFDLLTWPAKGNPNFRYNLDFSPVETDPNLFPAPFVDVNGDGIYNVYDGDYPRIPGDQMAWWVLTDSTAHLHTAGNIVGVDLGISAYVFDCMQNETIEKSLLVDVEVINRGQTDYHNTFMGFFTDADLGCYYDDYIGSLPGSNTFYAYNFNGIDYDCPLGVKGFGDHIPVQTITYLNQSLDRFIYFNNPGVGVPLPGSTDPDLPNEFYNVLQGMWRDGTPLTTGGSGYNPGSTDYTNYAFPGNPADPQGWSMCTAFLPYDDRRMMGSHGPFNFAAGDTFRITTAFTMHFDVPPTCPNIAGLVKPRVEQLQQWHDDGSLAATVDLGQVVILPPGGVVTLNAGIPGGLSCLWSTGATTNSIDVAMPGDYSVLVTLASGCQKMENVLVQLGTGTSQPAETLTWSVRPNPASDAVMIECPDCNDENLKVVIRNAQGALTMTATGQNGRVRLEMRNRPPGFYWVELWQDGRFSGTRKLVLNNN